MNEIETILRSRKPIKTKVGLIEDLMAENEKTIFDKGKAWGQSVAKLLTGKGGK